MANEKRLIDADYLVTMIARNAKLSVTAFSEISRIIRNIETVDAVEVLRCKGCNWHTGCQAPSVVFCKKYNTFMAADDFCSYGERKDNG